MLRDNPNIHVLFGGRHFLKNKNSVFKITFYRQFSPFVFLLKILKSKLLIKSGVPEVSSTKSSRNI